MKHVVGRMGLKGSDRGGIKGLYKGGRGMMYLARQSIGFSIFNLLSKVTIRIAGKSFFSFMPVSFNIVTDNSVFFFISGLYDTVG